MQFEKNICVFFDKNTCFFRKKKHDMKKTVFFFHITIHNSSERQAVMIWLKSKTLSDLVPQDFKYN